MFDSLDSQVRGIVDNTNNVRQEGQLSPIFDIEIDPETGRKKETFPNYVPLRGSLDDGDETTEIVNRKPRQTKGREDPRITGRSKYAQILLAILYLRICQLYEESNIIRLVCPC